MCNSELYLTVVTGGGGGLAGQSGAAVGQHGGGLRWLRCLCVSRVGTHPLPRNTRARRYICVCVTPYKHYLHVLHGGGGRGRYEANT